MAKAGLAKQYTPHGLRKRCLTNLAESGRTIHQIMAISGHLTTKEVERYTKMADRARNARAAMTGRVQSVNGKVSHSHRCDSEENGGGRLSVEFLGIFRHSECRAMRRRERDVARNAAISVLPLRWTLDAHIGRLCEGPKPNHAQGPA
jgi:hypothetical protein